MKARKKVKILAWEKMVVLHQMSVATLSSKAMGNGGRFDRVCFDDDENLMSTYEIDYWVFGHTRL